MCTNTNTRTSLPYHSNVCIDRMPKMLQQTNSAEDESARGGGCVLIGWTMLPDIIEEWRQIEHENRHRSKSFTGSCQRQSESRTEQGFRDTASRSTIHGLGTHS